MAATHPIDPDKPPSAAERKHLETRLRRLYDTEKSYVKARANLAAIATGSMSSSPVTKGEVRVRDTFVYREGPAPGDASDRRLPMREYWPPAGRLANPRGAALRLMLIALFEAQARTMPGQRPDNPRPLQGKGNEIGWTDLLATDAKPALDGLTAMSVLAKKGRHLFSALELLHAEDLISLPHGQDRKNKHRGFLLNDEGGERPSGPNDLYRVPRKTEAYFSLPIALFTSGWIHVLEDSELRYLLMLCRYHHMVPDGFGFKVEAGTRLLHMAIGPDTYDRHIWFTRFGLNEVTPDDGRRDDGTVEEYGKGRKAIPHTLRLLPDGFEQDGLRIVTRVIDEQLNR